MTKIILDDARTFPDGDYNCVRNYSDCILLLSLNQEIEFISLDFDLGTTEETGLDVLNWMVAHNIKAKQINIHSDHPVGGRQMEKFAREHYNNVTKNHI